MAIAQSSFLSGNLITIVRLCACVRGKDIQGRGMGHFLFSEFLKEARCSAVFENSLKLNGLNNTIFFFNLVTQL